MINATAINPDTGKPTGVTQVDMWIWNEGDEWFARCPNLEGVVTPPMTGYFEALRDCQGRIGTKVNEFKNNKQPVQWIEEVGPMPDGYELVHIYVS